MICESHEKRLLTDS